MADAGLVDSQRTYVHEKDRHLFVAARIRGAIVVVPNEHKILKGRGRLGPYLVGRADEFTAANP